MARPDFSFMYNLHRYLRMAGVPLAFSGQHPLRHSGCIVEDLNLHLGLSPFFLTVLFFCLTIS